MEYLIPLMLAALVILAGIVLLASGWIKGSPRLRRAGAGMIAAPWLFLGALFIIRPGIDEWNPEIESDDQVRGTWEGGGKLIDLKSDGSFACSAVGANTRGRWMRNDWNLHLTGEDGGKRRMRFVKDSGELLLLPEPPTGESREDGPVMRRK